MAQRTVVTYVDDMDNTEHEDIETVVFALDGASYEIDLGTDNAEKLREALAPYVVAGRRTVTSRGRRRAVHQAATDADPAAVRAWADANGVEVAARGRISAAIIEQFHAAGN